MQDFPPTLLNASILIPLDSVLHTRWPGISKQQFGGIPNSFFECLETLALIHMLN